MLAGPSQQFFVRGLIVVFLQDAIESYTPDQWVSYLIEDLFQSCKIQLSGHLRHRKNRQV